MQEQADKLEPHIQRLVDAGVSGIDIMHGDLKIKIDRKSTRLNSSHSQQSRMPSSA